ncbi:MAG: amidase [Rhodobacteraceae bacterium PARR1]|nr:MAG: amidase [Rhodobacteraceae bacterium PARR1]
MAGHWALKSAAELGREINAGRISPVDLAEAHLDAIGGHPQADRIFARTTPARARAEAMAAHGRARTGQRRSLIDGVPISWKDNFDTAGIATEAGSALLKNRVPVKDAEVLTTATLMGLVCLGKTHMSELAFSGLGLNPITATPPCINDDRAVPGGSSSGAAASVAFGLAPAAIGSDTGGSVRIPAAWNDLVGLKTTAGRLSIGGVVPLCESFDTVGPIARNVEDCAHLFAALEGVRPIDLSGGSLSGMRFLVLDTVALDDLRDAPGKGFQDSLTRLSAAGARLDHAEVPAVAEAMGLAPILFTSEAYAIWREVIEAAPSKMFPRILERFRSGGNFAAADYVAALRRLRDLRAAWGAAVAAYDALLVPTAPILPPDAARLMTDDGYYVTENLLALRNTRIGNLMGGCALTLPTSQPSCGISFMCAAGREEKLLRIGAAAELALR